VEVVEMAVRRSLSTVADPALDEALDRVRELALRLWAVRGVHRPRRALLGGARCAGCGRPYPCATLRAAS
jgi:hypothetical protein